MAAKPTYEELEQRVESLEQELEQRKYADVALREREEPLAEVLASFYRSAVVLYDREGIHRAVWGSKDLEERYGTPNSVFLGVRITDLYPSDEGKRRLGRILHVFETGETIHETVLTPYPTGQFWQDITITPLYGPSGEVSRVVVFLRDVNDQMEAEAKSKRERFFSDTLMDGLPGIFFLLDKHGDFVRWNKNFQRVSGYSEEEIRAMRPEDLFSGEDENFIAETLQEVLQRGDSGAEARLIAKDGTEVPYDFKGLRVVLEDEPYAIAIGIDIAARIKTEEALRDSEEQLRGVLASFHKSAVVLLDREGTHVAVWGSPDLEDYYGMKTSEFEGRKLTDLYPPDGAEMSARHIRHVFETGEMARYQAQVAYPKGQFWQDVTLTPLFGPSGEITRAVAFVRDVTEQKVAEEKWRREELFSDTLVDSMPGVFFLINEQVGLTRWNRNVEMVSAYSSDELESMLTTDLFEGEERTLIAEKIRGAFETGHADAEAHLTAKDGSRVPHYFNGLRVFLDEKPYILAVGTDITERIRVEQELLRHRDHLDEMVKERTRELEEAQAELVKRERLAVLGQITATVSHELRNPLGVVRSSAFYLKGKIRDPDEKVHKHLERIEGQVELCDGIVEDLLEYTRGRRAQSTEKDLGGWLKRLVAQTQERREGEIAAHIDPDLPKVPFDPEKIRRIVVNLINNAQQAVQQRRKESKGKEASYRPLVALTASRANEGVLIEVEDNGIGMSRETAEKAFEPLFTTRARGTGLGLAIVQKIAEEHGGSVALKSEPGRGTTVSVTIPAERKNLKG